MQPEQIHFRISACIRHRFHKYRRGQSNKRKEQFAKSMNKNSPTSGKGHLCVRFLAGILLSLLLGSSTGYAAGEEAVHFTWQTEEEILKLAEEGTDLREFFRYSIWDFLDKELLSELVQAGHTLEDAWMAIEACREEGDAAREQLSPDLRKITEAYEQNPEPLALEEQRIAGFSGAMSSALGNIPALGSGSHGPILKIHLSGETAFCARFGAACRTGMKYTSVPLSDIGLDEGKACTVRALLAQYREAQQIYNGPANYIMTQAGIWLVQNGKWTGDGEKMAKSIAPLFSKTPDCPSTAFAADYFRAIVEWMNHPDNRGKIENTGLEAWALGPNQYLVTATGEGGSLEELGAYARVKLVKKDSETGNIIADEAEFTILQWNGSTYEESGVSMNREGDDYVSDDLFRTEKNQGKFCLEESRAPHTGNQTGYRGDYEAGKKKQYLFQVKEGMKGDTLLITNEGGDFVNHRVTGKIVLKKLDVEADTYVEGTASHGSSSLDGAIYDLYAAEPVIHPDGVTGAVYRAGEWVAAGTVKNGSCTFENLYLGSYEIRERQKGETRADGKKLSYGEGYLLDETRYPVTLSYEGEETAIVQRQVVSRKEQVIKAKAVWEKVESAAGQGTIRYLQGAGFTVYRIDRLSRRSLFEKNSDGTWTEESIRKAYLVKGYTQDQPKYDFSGENEAIATLYVRDTSLREDTAGYWADAQEDLREGRLIPLGGHAYRVAELFSDKDGRVSTPYLPYGQYLVAETTVPKDHFMAPPFVLTFYQDRTEKIQTVGVTEDTPYGRNLRKSRGDTVNFWEAVYFSGVLDNEATEQLLRLYKKDMDTGKTVLLADTRFRIARLNEKTGEKTYLTHTSYYPDTVNREEFSTNREGYLQLPELLPVGLYQIEETEGPEGFYNDIPGGYVQFRVTTERAYRSLAGTGEEGSTLEGEQGSRDVLLILEHYGNRETRGVLTLRKAGEQLTGYEPAGLRQRLRGFLGLSEKRQFRYEMLPLSGAEYTVRAAEDIVTRDRQTDEEGKRTLWFRKGETVAVLVTGEDGQIDEVRPATAEYPDGHPILNIRHDGTEGSVSVTLPLGSYEIEETRAPWGYVKNTEIRTVTFTWEHQFQEFLYEEWREENRRVQAVPEEGYVNTGVGIRKTASENGQPLEGVSFGLYTPDGIYGKDGEQLVEAGTLLGICVTDEDGKGSFKVDLPIRSEHYGEQEHQNSGIYEIRELETPEGILMDAEPVQVEFRYVDDRTEYVVVRGEKRNKTSELKVAKRDLTDGEELPGARLTILEDWSGRVLHTWISDGTVREIRGLAVNGFGEKLEKTYTLTEQTAPQGYQKAESIRFALQEEEDGSWNRVWIWERDTGVWSPAADRTVILYNAPGGNPEQPESPDTPDTSKPSSGGSRKSGKAKSVQPVKAAPGGDDTPAVFYLGLFAVALLIIAAMWSYPHFRYRRSRKPRS